MVRYVFHTWLGGGSAAQCESYDLADDADATALSFFVLRDHPAGVHVQVLRDDELILIRRLLPGAPLGELTRLRPLARSGRSAATARQVGDLSNWTRSIFGPHDIPSEVHLAAGEVLVDGPGGLAVSLTPAAAAETGRRLTKVAKEAGAGDGAKQG